MAMSFNANPSKQAQEVIFVSSQIRMSLNFFFQKQLGIILANKISNKHLKMTSIMYQPKLTKQ